MYFKMGGDDFGLLLKDNKPITLSSAEKEMASGLDSPELDDIIKAIVGDTLFLKEDIYSKKPPGTSLVGQLPSVKPPTSSTKTNLKQYSIPFYSEFVIPTSRTDVVGVARVADKDDTLKNATIQDTLDYFISVFLRDLAGAHWPIGSLYYLIHAIVLTANPNVANAVAEFTTLKTLILLGSRFEIPNIINLVAYLRRPQAETYHLGSWDEALADIKNFDIEQIKNSASGENINKMLSHEDVIAFLRNIPNGLAEAGHDVLYQTLANDYFTMSEGLIKHDVIAFDFDTNSEDTVGSLARGNPSSINGFSGKVKSRTLSEFFGADSGTFMPHIRNDKAVENEGNLDQASGYFGARTKTGEQFYQELTSTQPQRGILTQNLHVLLNNDPNYPTNITLNDVLNEDFQSRWTDAKKLIEDEVIRLIYLMSLGNVINKSFFEDSLSMGLPFPGQFILARPNQEFSTAHGIYLKSGYETGFTVNVDTRFVDGIDPNTGIVTFHYSTSSAGVVANPTNVMVLSNLSVQEYISGGGIRFYDDVQQLKTKNENRSIFCFYVAPGEKIPHMIDMLGYYNVHMVDANTTGYNPSNRQFVNAGWYQDYWGFKHPVTSHTSSTQMQDPNSQTERHNTILMGDYFEYNVIVDNNGRYETKRMTGKGHLGPIRYDNFLKDLQGKQFKHVRMSINDGIQRELM